MTRKKPKKAENGKKKTNIFFTGWEHMVELLLYLIKFPDVLDKLYITYSLIQLITASSEIVRTVCALAIM